MKQHLYRLGVLAALLAATAAGISAIAQFRPSPASGDVSLKSSTAVPFVLARNTIYIPVSIKGKRFEFIFDTGGQAVLTAEAQAEMHFPVESTALMNGAGVATSTVDMIRVDDLTIGSATLRGASAAVLASPLPHADAIPGLKFGGIIGREFLRALVVTIDYEHDVLTLTNPAAFSPPRRIAPIALSMRRGTFPNVPAALDGTKGRFDVDSGSSAAVTLKKSFASQTRIATSGPPIRTDLGRGVGGYMRGTLGRARALAIGPYVLERPLAGIVDADAGAFADEDLDGNIGAQILERFTVVLDVPASKAYLIPNRQLREPFTYNRSGLTYEFLDTGCTVVFVAPRSAAQTAGIRPGDVIQSVDGSASNVNQDRLSAIFLRPPGTRVAIAVLRAGKRAVLQLTLHDVL